MSSLSRVSSTDSSLFSSPSPSPSVSSASSLSSSPSHFPFQSAKQYILPSSHFANEQFLRDLSETLGKGAGDLLFFYVPKDGAPITTKQLGSALKEVAKLIGCEVAESWMQIITVARDLSVPYYSSTRDSHGCLGLNDILCGDHSNCEQGATKLTQSSALYLFSLCALRSIFSYETNSLKIYVLERPATVFPPLTASPSFSSLSPANVASTPYGVPSISEWKTLWATWDLVTLGMIPSSMLHQKPIDLRHKCLFYIGHIPTFLDMLMSKALGEPNTEPKNYTVIFERGIDPHVDDPDHCHSHSEVPATDEDWPTLEEILAFRNKVRARLVALYDDLSSKRRPINRNIARMLVMTLEHEGFHVETLLYMVIQRAGSGTLPPPGFTAPPWASLVEQWAQETPALSEATTELGPATITLGHDDSEADDFAAEFREAVNGHEFGWDNESPPRAVNIEKFKIDWRPVSNGEFYAFWTGKGAPNVKMPKSWVREDGIVKVRTLYGPVSMDIARDWPVLTSFDDLLRYAKYKGGRIPTEAELRLFLDMYEIGHNGGANVGFRNWHPIPATTGGTDCAGRGSNGGVWEWTSTVFDDHPGLVPTDHFTGYSNDFFDGKHHVVLGASYATIPRIASRRTLRNFYQHNYPYPWVAARVAYDI